MAESSSTKSAADFSFSNIFAELEEVEKKRKQEMQEEVVRQVEAGTVTVSQFGHGQGDGSMIWY